VEFLPFKIKLLFSTTSSTGGENINVNTSELTNILSEYFDDFLTDAFPDEDDAISSSTDIGIGDLEYSYSPFSHVSLLSMPERRRQLKELDQDRIPLDGFFVDDDMDLDLDFYGDITEGVKNDGNVNHHDHKYHQKKWISWSSLTSPLRNLKSMTKPKPKEEDYNDTSSTGFKITRTRIKPGNLRGRGLNGNDSGNGTTYHYEVSRRYSGVAIFTRENNLPIPSVNMLQAQQLSAQADVHNLKNRLQMSMSKTLNQVSDVEIGVHMRNTSNNNGNTGTGNGNDGYSSGGNGDQTNPALEGGGFRGTTGTNAVIVIAVAVAACSMCLLGFALYLAFRRRQIDETVPTNQHQGRNGQLQMKEMATPRYGQVGDNDFAGDLHGQTQSSSKFITPKDGSHNRHRHRQRKGQTTSPNQHQKHQKISAAPPVAEMHLHPHHDDAISEYTESVYSVTGGGGGSSVKSRLSVSQHKHHQQRRQMLQDAAALESQNGGLSQKDAKVSNRFNPRYIISAATSKRSRSRSRSNASASSSDEADMSMADFCGASYNETPGKGQSLGSGLGLGSGPGRGASQEMEGVPQLTTPMKEALMMQTNQLGQSHTQSYSMSIDTPSSPLSGISNDVRDKAVAKLNTGSTCTTPLSTSTSTNSNGNVDVDNEIAALSGIVSSPRSKAKYSPSGLYPADVIDNDITSSLAEYSKGTSIGKHFRKLLGENNDDDDSSTIAGNTITNLLVNENTNNDAHDGGASVSSYESYGFSLDGADYSTVANSTKYGY